MKKLEAISKVMDLSVDEKNIDSRILEDVSNGALAFVSHSGGKDSQAMYQIVKRYFPVEQIVIVHADLGIVEWENIQQHIIDNVDGHIVNVVKNERRDFLQMVEQRGMWPSPAFRTCTSDLKTGPIRKFVRRVMTERQVKIAYNCTGIRAEESSKRAKKSVLSVNSDLTYADPSKRLVWDWNPAFKMAVDDVFTTIEAAGQRAFWAYERNERLSCVFCIMASVNDLVHGAENRPDLYAYYVALERSISHTIFMKDSGFKLERKSFMVPEPLYEKVGIAPDWSLVDKYEKEIYSRLSDEVKQEASARKDYYKIKLADLEYKQSQMISVQVELF